MTHYQLAGLVVFVMGFISLWVYVTRVDGWLKELGRVALFGFERVARTVYVFGFVGLPIGFGLALVYFVKM